MNVQLVLTVLAVRKDVAVKTVVNATITMETACVSQASQARCVMSDCVPKETMAYCVTGSVHAIPRICRGTVFSTSHILLSKCSTVEHLQ